MKKRYVTFKSCKHESYVGRAKYEGYIGSTKLVAESGCCTDCRWNMRRNIETVEFEKTTKISKKEAEELELYRELRGMK